MFFLFSLVKIRREDTGTPDLNSSPGSFPHGTSLLTPKRPSSLTHPSALFIQQVNTRPPPWSAFSTWPSQPSAGRRRSRWPRRPRGTCRSCSSTSPSSSSACCSFTSSSCWAAESRTERWTRFGRGCTCPSYTTVYTSITHCIHTYVCTVRWMCCFLYNVMTLTDWLHPFNLFENVSCLNNKKCNLYNT